MFNPIFGTVSEKGEGGDGSRSTVSGQPTRRANINQLRVAAGRAQNRGAFQRASRITNEIQRRGSNP